MQINSGQARAAKYLETVNRAIILAASERRQGIGRGDGARSIAGLAAAPVDLALITAQRGAIGDPTTPVGYKTAVRARSRALAGLDARHPHIIAAGFLADAYERIGAVQGSSFGGGDTNETKGGQSDGGVTTRIKHAARLSLIEAVVNKWDIDACHGVVVEGVARTVLSARRGAGKRQQILAFPFLVAVCVEGLDLADVLRLHGWSVQSKHTGILAGWLAVLLDDVGRALVDPRQARANRC